MAARTDPDKFLRPCFLVIIFGPDFLILTVGRESLLKNWQQTGLFWSSGPGNHDDEVDREWHLTLF